MCSTDKTTKGLFETRIHGCYALERDKFNFFSDKYAFSTFFPFFVGFLH